MRSQTPMGLRARSPSSLTPGSAPPPAQPRPPLDLCVSSPVLTQSVFSASEAGNHLSAHLLSPLQLCLSAASEVLSLSSRRSHLFAFCAHPPPRPLGPRQQGPLGSSLESRRFASGLAGLGPSRRISPFPARFLSPRPTSPPPSPRLFRLLSAAPFPPPVWNAVSGVRFGPPFTSPLTASSQGCLSTLRGLTTNFLKEMALLPLLLSLLLLFHLLPSTPHPNCPTENPPPRSPATCPLL